MSEYAHDLLSAPRAHGMAHNLEAAHPATLLIRFWRLDRVEPLAESGIQEEGRGRAVKLES